MDCTGALPFYDLFRLFFASDANEKSHWGESFSKTRVVKVAKNE